MLNEVALTTRPPRGRPPGSTSSGKMRLAADGVSGVPIPDHDSVGFLNALRLAYLNNREPTQFVTIHWALLKSRRGVDAMMRRLKNKAGQWLKARTGEPAVWLQFREMGDSWDDKGDHCHLMIWIPESQQAAFKAMLTRWITAEAATATLHPDALDVRPITPGTTQTTSGLRSYGLKEATLAIFDLGLVSVSHRYRATGLPVPGQRLQVAQTIDRAARKAAGYIDQPASFFAQADNVVALTPRRASSTTSTATTALAA